MTKLPAEIFKAYDIRGIVDKSLTADVVRRIGHALGSLAVEQGQKAIAVGRDGRLTIWPVKIERVPRRWRDRADGDRTMSRVVPETPLAAALQPIVTIILALIFLGEKIGLLEGAGIALAILAAVALSCETKPAASPAT